MPRLLRSRPALVGLVVALLGLGAVGFLPLFGGPGYESALAAGIVLPFVVAIVTALEIAALPRALGGAVRPVAAFERGLANGGAFALAAYGLTLLHGLRVGFCDLPLGSAHFALGPVPGALLAGAYGALVGELARGRRRRRLVAVLAAIAGPLGSMLFSVGRFYASPMVFAYDPFAGYFSGTLYDTVIDFSGLVSYRAGTLATLVAGFIVALHLGRDGAGKLVVVGQRRGTVLVVGALAGVASAASMIEGDRLGHWETPASIQKTLGARVSGQRCEVIHPRGMRPADVERFVRDCDAHVVEGERYFEIAGPAKITVYLFADAAQKAALMGAADTYIAKPWRHEIYVQTAGYPHSVVGHELMHVLAGSFGRGPFHVAGSAFGLLPNPGLIEGAAVAAAPPDGDLTPRQWAKAMKDLGLLPRLDSLFNLGFLGQNASTAYTVSGAFVGWVHDRYGAAALRAWYGGRPLAEVTGVPWATLERTWQGELDAITLPDAARAQARARFDRPAIFGRACPRIVDACKNAGDRLHNGGDEAGARAKYEEVLRLDPHDGATPIAIARSLIAEGRVDEGLGALAQIADRATERRDVRDRAIEELGDQALAAGRGAEAVRRFEDVAARTVDEDRLRTFEVKIAAAKDERGRAAIVALLVGTRGRGPDKALAMERLAAWSAADPDDGLPLYLLGRHYFGAGQFEEAAERLSRALAARITLPRVAAEAARLRMITACGLGDRDGAEMLFQRYAASAGVSEARRLAAAAFVRRCTGKALSMPESAAQGGT
jgi:tetratricopeptide (TPR) repeat protein